MCQGVRDVVNLSWKLRAVLAGEVAGSAAERLLDSYTTERREHVRMLTTRIKEIGAVICERDPQAAGARDAALIEAAGGTIRTVPRQDIIPPLVGGLLASSRRSGTGTLFPQPRVNGPAGPALLDELAGAGWRIVTNLPTTRLPPGLMALAGRIGIVVSIPSSAHEFSSGPHRMQADELDGVLARWFERHGCCAAVVRPDHYVYGVADSGQALYELVGGLLATLD
jgi:3-(3-hydroxy-phenyl)propionate hydroxylase